MIMALNLLFFNGVEHRYTNT